MSSDSEDSGSAAKQKASISFMQVSRNDPGQCNRAIDKYKLVGKFSLMDIACRMLQIIQKEYATNSYVGLTSLSPYQRMHTYSAAHFPDKGRSIFWIPIKANPSRATT